MQDRSTSGWHLLGAGAIGTLFGAELHQAGVPTTLVLRSSQRCAEMAEAGGLSLTRDGREVRFIPHLTSPEQEGPIRRLLITTKSYQSLDALATIADRLSDDALVVVLHNGFGPQQQAAERWPGLRIYAGTTTEGAYRETPYRVVHAGRGETWLGPVNDAAQRAGGTPLQDLLNLSIGCRYDPEINTRLWQKLAINAAINGLTVIHDCRNGELASNLAYRWQMEALCEETNVLAATLEQPLFERPLFETAVAVAEATADNYSSMLQDVRHGRRTELDSINGTLCRLAEQNGVDLPTHRWLIAEVQRRCPNSDATK